MTFYTQNAYEFTRLMNYNVVIHRLSLNVCKLFVLVVDTVLNKNDVPASSSHAYGDTISVRSRVFPIDGNLSDATKSTIFRQLEKFSYFSFNGCDFNSIGWILFLQSRNAWRTVHYILYSFDCAHLCRLFCGQYF